MLLRLILNYRSSGIVILVQRSLITKSDFQLSQKMKTSNENKQYRKTIEIFYENKKHIKEIRNCSSYIISHILKACICLNDIELGSQIHYEVKSRVSNDSFVLFPLIQLYCKCSIILVFLV